MMKKAVLWLIRLYQKTLSPDQGLFRFYYPRGLCPYWPHCSEYGHQAISKYGLGWGGLKALGRICRCHPWSRGGHDPV